MKRILLICTLLGMISSTLFGCVASGKTANDNPTVPLNTQDTTHTSPSQPATDPTFAPTDPEIHQVSYTIADYYYSEIDWADKNKSSAILIRSTSELAQHCGGMLPQEVLHDDNFFAEKSLIAIQIYSGGIPFYAQPGELTVGADGNYTLDIQFYQPIIVDDAVGHTYFYIEVNKVIDPGATLEIKISDHYCEDFADRFPDPFR